MNLIYDSAPSWSCCLVGVGFCVLDAVPRTDGSSMVVMMIMVRVVWFIDGLVRTEI